MFSIELCHRVYCGNFKFRNRAEQRLTELGFSVHPAGNTFFFVVNAHPDNLDKALKRLHAEIWEESRNQ